MNIRVRDGRLLADTDGNGASAVAVISRSLAQRYFPNQNPLGRKVQVNPSEETGPWITVVGIVDDVHYSWINKEEIPTIYRSFRQSPRSYVSMVMRTAGDPLALVNAARSRIASVDAEIPLFDVKSLDKVISESVVGIAYVAAMMGVMGVIALVLASVGVYGVMSYAVAERTNEFGIRMAMGATAGDIQRLVLSKGFLLTGVGIGLGMPLAFAMANALSSLLFGVKAADPAAFIGLPLLLAAISMLASYLPAMRAVRVDPIVALRYE
jgi:putative ABC transport system permease protein